MNKTEREKEVARLREIGSKGGKATKEKHGTKHLSEIGSRGGKNRWA